MRKIIIIAVAVIAAGLGAYARLGIQHLQLVLDPIDAASIERLAPVLECLAAGGR